MNAEEQTEEEAAVPETWRGDGTILLADDNAIMLALGRRMLGQLGITSLLASDGVEAMEVFREHKDDIVCDILDLTMLRMSGGDAFREIRQIKPDFKVILCSGYDEQQVIQEYAGKGLAGFLQKPYTSQHLKMKLRQVLD